MGVKSIWYKGYSRSRRDQRFVIYLNGFVAIYILLIWPYCSPTYTEIGSTIRVALWYWIRRNQIHYSECNCRGCDDFGAGVSYMFVQFNCHFTSRANRPVILAVSEHQMAKRDLLTYYSNTYLILRRLMLPSLCFPELEILHVISQQMEKWRYANTFSYCNRFKARKIIDHINHDFLADG
jgi:hypothetical protein